MMKRAAVGSIFLFIISILGHAEGLDSLARKVSDGLLGHFSGKESIKTAIVKFDNFSDVSDLAAHKFYQILISSLENASSPQFAYTDLMVNFIKRRGEFNLNRIDQLNYLIYVRLVKNRDKIGAGIAVFSRNLDRLVYIKYFEDMLPPGERDLYEARDYGFKGTGFSMEVEIDAEKNLLDFKTILNPDRAAYRYFFYYPEKIDIFINEDNSFKKFFSYKLAWGRPYYPVLNHEGKLSLFYHENGLYITVGSNFSPRSKIFCLKDNLWKEIALVDFVPLKLIRLNQNDYIAGARYDEGKNYFNEKLYLAPLVSGEVQKEGILEKRVPASYSLDFSAVESTEGGGALLESIHLIDTAYNYRFLAGDFEELAVEPDKRGSALAVLDGRWLAVSDYSTALEKDKLFFYKIEEGSKRQVYENPVHGQVVFISPGAWKENRGFWVYVKRTRERRDEYRLQFWSKKNDE